MGGGVCIYQSSTPTTFLNNIIVGSLNGYGIYVISSSASIQYSDVWDNSPGNYYGTGAGAGCISADPVFCDPASDNYFLSAKESPCLGTGQGGSNMGALGIGCAYVLITPGEDQGGPAYSQVVISFFIQNLCDFTDSFDLDVSDQLGWNIEPTHYDIGLGPSQVDTVDFTVSIPNAPIGHPDTVCLRGNPQGNPSDTNSACLAVYCDSYILNIAGISDVGNDQGKQVRIDWSSFPSSDPLATDFTIFRRVDSLLFASLGLNPKMDLVLDYPPGTWEMVGTFPAFGESLYSATVPTLKDSTISEGIYWSVFFTRAGTGNPTIYFDSPIDSGYSLDNLSPSPPAGLFACHKPAVTQLTWTRGDDIDFDYHTLYRDTTSGFEPSSATMFAYATDTVFADSTAELAKVYYYLVSTTDFSGNESNPCK